MSTLFSRYVKACDIATNQCSNDFTWNSGKYLLFFTVNWHHLIPTFHDNMRPRSITAITRMLPSSDMHGHPPSSTTLENCYNMWTMNIIGVIVNSSIYIWVVKFGLFIIEHMCNVNGQYLSFAAHAFKLKSYCISLTYLLPLFLSLSLIKTLCSYITCLWIKIVHGKVQGRKMKHEWHDSISKWGLGYEILGSDYMNQYSRVCI